MYKHAFPFVVFLCAVVADASLASAKPAAPEGDRLIAVITGLRTDSGTVRCAVYLGPDGFPEQAERAVGRVIVKPSQGTARCEFQVNKPGTYAVSFFHDENGNERMDKNFLGIPKEGYGVSRNAIPAFRAPRFDEAAFKYERGPLTLTLAMNY